MTYQTAAASATVPLPPMQLTAGPGGDAVQSVNAVVPVTMPTTPPQIYAAGPPPPRQPASVAVTTAFAAAPAPAAAAYQPIIYWYPSPPVSPQTAAYYFPTATMLPTTVLMKGLPSNIQINDVLSFLDGLVEVCFKQLLRHLLLL